MDKMVESSSSKTALIAPAGITLWWLAVVSAGWQPGVAAWAGLSLAFWPLAWPALRRADIAPAQPLALLCGWLIIALPFSGEPLNSVWTVSHYLVYAAFYFAVCGAGGRAKEWITRIAHIAAYAAALWILTAKFYSGEWLGAVFQGTRLNAAACFAAAAFAGSFAIVLDETYPRWKRGASALPAVIALSAVAATSSRGGLLACAAAVALALAYSRRWKALLWCAAAVTTAGLLAPQSILDAVFKSGDPYALGRLHIWKVALAVIAHNPLCGIGAGCFERGYLALTTAYQTGLSFFGRYALSAHSQPLNLAAESGLPAAVLFLIFALGAFWNGRKNPAALRPVLIAGAVFTQSLADGIMFYAPVSFLFFGMLACAQPEAETAPVRRLPRAVPALAFIFCAGAAIVQAYGRNALERLNSPSAPAVRAEAARQALTIYPQDTGIWFDAARLELQNPVPSPYAALDKLNRAAELSPKSALYRYQRGGIYALLGLYPKAAEDFSAALRLEPNYIAPQAALAILVAQSGDAAAAKKLIAAAENAAAMCAASARGGYEKGILCAPADAELAAARALLSERLLNR